MLDTLKLRLTDYEIEPGCWLDVQPATFNPGSNERPRNHRLWGKGSAGIHGAKAYSNQNDVFVTVQPMRVDDPDSVACHVQFSVPKVASGSNYQPADYHATKQALEEVERRLAELRVNTNIKTAAITRLDSCKRPETEEPYEAYQPIFSMLRGQRMAKRDYGTTFLWHNTVQEVCVYDKIEEMRRTKRPVKGLPQNVVSFEHRLLKGRKVLDATGLRSVDDLLNGFDQVGEAYRAGMKKQLFNHTPDEVRVVTANDIVEQLRRVKNASEGEPAKRYYVQDWLMNYAFSQLGDDADALLMAVEQVSDSRKTHAKLRKQLERARIEALNMRESMASQRTIGDLYRELEAKVLGV